MRQRQQQQQQQQSLTDLSYAVYPTRSQREAAPFLEDVQNVNPTVYVIHNLLTPKECESLIRQAAPLVQPLQRNDPLQYTTQYDKFVNTKRVHLWEGTWQSPERKAIQERVEQQTGFSAAHLSDWTVNQLTAGSYWQPHYDILLGNYVPMATITVFLSATTSNITGGDFVFPNTDESDPPLRIQPSQGLAVVHHNADEQHQFDLHALHALLPVTTTGADEFFYVATNYILALPASNARRVVLPALAAPWQGRLPEGIATLHDALISQLGVDTGGLYFDKVCVFVPILLVLLLAQTLGLYVHRRTKKASISNGRSSGRKPTATTKTAETAAGVANPKSTTKAKKNKKKD